MGSAPVALLVEDALFGLAQMGYAECVLWVAEQNEAAKASTGIWASTPTTPAMCGEGCPSCATAWNTFPVRLD
jgi:hypothetical protein